MRHDLTRAAALVLLIAVSGCKEARTQQEQPTVQPVPTYRHNGVRPGE